MAVKGDLREAGDGAAREKEVMELQKCQGEEHCCVCTHAHPCVILCSLSKCNPQFEITHSVE